VDESSEGDHAHDEHGEQHRGRPRTETDDRRHGEDHEISTRQVVDAADAPCTGPHECGAGREPQPVVEALGEDGVALGNERSEGGGEQGETLIAPCDLQGEQERENDTDRGERNVGKPHQDEPTVGGLDHTAAPDQRRHRHVVQRRVIRHPDGSVADVTGGRALGLPLPGLDGDFGEPPDLGEPERRHLVRVAHVGGFVRRRERRLLERVEPADTEKRDHDRDESHQDRGAQAVGRGWSIGGRIAMRRNVTVGVRTDPRIDQMVVLRIVPICHLLKIPASPRLATSVPFGRGAVWHSDDQVIEPTRPSSTHSRSFSQA
jgi:hypothetical protein